MTPATTSIVSDAERCVCGYSLRGVSAARCPECGRSISSTGEIPLAVYRERRSFLRCDIALYTDRLVLHRRQTFGQRVIQPIPLSTLDPTPMVFWIRSQSLKGGSVLLVCGLGFLALLFTRPVSETLPTFAYYVVGAAILVGVLLIVFHLRAMECVSYSYRNSPGRYGLSVVKCGPDESTFNDFCATVREQILRSQPHGST